MWGGLRESLWEEGGASCVQHAIERLRYPSMPAWTPAAEHDCVCSKNRLLASVSGRRAPPGRTLGPSPPESAVRAEKSDGGEGSGILFMWIESRGVKAEERLDIEPREPEILGARKGGDKARATCKFSYLEYWACPTRSREPCA